MALDVRKANPMRPGRFLIYGEEGMGKSTFGAHSDKPIFITPEGGTDQLEDTDGVPVVEMKHIRTFADVRGAVNKLLLENHDRKTLVLDSADWIEKLAHDVIVGASGKSITTVNGGWNAGYRESELLHKKLIEELSALRDKKGMNIIVTAHAISKAVKDPEQMHDYNAFEIKCHEYVSSLWREWVDCLFFVRLRTFTKEVEGASKARAFSDGSRVIHTVKSPSFQAKNRYRLQPEYDFTENFWNTLQIERKKNQGGLKLSTADQIALGVECNKLWEQVNDPKQKMAISEFMVKTMKDKAPEEINWGVVIATRDRLKQIVATQAQVGVA